MKLLRTKHVLELTGLSRMTIYRMEKSGSFPARRQLGTNSVAWIEDDVAAWVRERPTPRARTTRPTSLQAGIPASTPATRRRTQTKPRGQQGTLAFTTENRGSATGTNDQKSES